MNPPGGENRPDRPIIGSRAGPRRGSSHVPPEIRFNMLSADSSQRAGVSTLTIDASPVSIENVLTIARGEAAVALSDRPEYRDRLERGAAFVQESHRAGVDIYGVTTGVGASVENQIPTPLRDSMARNLVRFHGIGTGALLTDDESAAVLATRLASLAQGRSGVRPIVLERIAWMLTERMLPLIPSEGSVGASGDLTPLSYLASALMGEREISLRGEAMTAAEAHERLGVPPIELRPKESLALMNGTSAMTGLAVLAFERARALAALASSITSIASVAVHGNPQHFDDRIFEWKAHPGSRACAELIRAHFEGAGPAKVARLQDRYSIRCAPHVIGVLLDALEFARGVLDVEINSVNDNPIVDLDAGDFLHGGNFYGGHICFVMDGLKGAIASVADLLDRQLALLCVPETSDGLPANLVAAAEEEGVAHHGFKAMQITASALTAEAQKLTMPASAFSRSTESHNQDKVSMGTIAARDCLRVLDLSERVGGIGLLAACQAMDLRGVSDFGDRSRTLHAFVRSEIPQVVDDRRQDVDLARLLERHHAGELPGIERGEVLEPLMRAARGPRADG